MAKLRAMASAGMVEVRRVQRPAEIAAVARLAREIWQEHYVPIIGQPQVDYMLEHFQSEPAVARQLGQAYEYFLLLQDGRAVGYTALVPDEGRASVLLSKLYVRRAERGLGWGKQLLGFVEELCRQRGGQTLWLTLNKHNAQSVALYERMGFRTAGSLVQDIGGGFVIDDIRMEKAL